MAPVLADTLNIPRKKLGKLVRDYSESARAVNLLYVNDKQEGISRKRSGDSFEYFFKGQKVKDEKTLLRIKKLVIPPAWENVWICAKENGHIQVTGYDVKNRKQYRYHSLWGRLRDKTKYYRLRDFAHSLPQMRQRLQKDLNLADFSKEKVLAAVVSIMECTCIRVGNNLYEKLYGSFGLSTLKDRHVNIKGDKAVFSFKGKKGVYHTISLKSRKLAKIIAQCKDIPGKELFQYIDKDGKRHAIDSGEVNEYIRTISGGDYTSKDFRTWNGTVQCLKAFNMLGVADTETQLKKNLNEAMDQVAKVLGNTRAVCKKHYVHPGILSDYENKRLDKYLAEMRKLEENNTKAKDTLSPAETVLVKILENS